MSRYKYLIGADPELFLVDADGIGRSAHNVIPGNKTNPMPVLNGAIQVDGVAAEFNIDPADTAEAFSGHIKDVLTELQERVEAKGKGLQLIVQPTMHFEPGYFKKLPKAAKELGCEPDYSAYTSHPNPKPNHKVTFRTGAGHLHIGWTQGENPHDGAHFYDCTQATRQLDSVLYFMSLLWDDDQQRRQLYGNIGAFRPKHYGVEYRPLSNAWVADPDLHIWLFNTTVHCMDLLDNGDTCLFHDYFQQSMLKDVREGRQPEKLQLLEYYDYLKEEYLIPEMPESYTRLAN